MDQFNELRESIGVELKESGVSYHLPKPYEDVLDNMNNVMHYSLAKDVLEHPEINPVLENMNAFDSINAFNIDTYKNLTSKVLNALVSYDTENKDTDFETKLFEGMGEAEEELDEFQELFILEFMGNSLMDKMPSKEDAEEMMGSEMPLKSNSWMQKLMDKLGVDTGELALIAVIHHFMKKNKNKLSRDNKYGMDDLNSKEPTTTATSSTSNSYSPMDRNYAQQPAMAMESLEESEEESNEEVTNEDDLNESDDGFMKVKDERPTRTVPKVTAKVKADVKSRLKEIDELIANYEEKPHFYGDVKPAVFNAKEAINLIMDKLGTGNELDYKDAQVHFGTLMSGITGFFPPSLVKFLSHCDDGEDSVGEEIEV